MEKIKPLEYCQDLCLCADCDAQQLPPLTFLRPWYNLTLGYHRLAEMWGKATGASTICYSLYPHLAPCFAEYSRGDIGAASLYIEAPLLPTPALLEQLSTLEPGEALCAQGQLLAVRNTSYGQWGKHRREKGCAESLGSCHDWDSTKGPVPLLVHPYDLFLHAKEGIELSVLLYKGEFTHYPHGEGMQTIGPRDQLYVSSSAKLTACTLNTEEGPIIIGQQVELQEGSHLRGPLVLGDYTLVHMGSKLYGNTVIGAHCKVGGELDNVVFQDYTNKAHDGYLGNACLGSWCNIGAGSNCSNLKNNYAPVRVYDYATGRFAHTGLQFCGLIMGDHSKCGINTMFNTGTVVGAFCNIFGAGFPRQFIPSFSWGGASGFTPHKFVDALETARVVMARRQKELTPELQAAIKELWKDSGGENEGEVRH